MYIAFSDKGNVFVTRYSEICVNVYEGSGKKKTAIVPGRGGKLQFRSPCGIVIGGEVLYFAEYRGY